MSDLLERSPASPESSTPSSWRLPESPPSAPPGHSPAAEPPPAPTNAEFHRHRARVRKRIRIHARQKQAEWSENQRDQVVRAVILLAVGAGGVVMIWMGLKVLGRIFGG